MGTSHRLHIIFAFSSYLSFLFELWNDGGGEVNISLE